MDASSIAALVVAACALALYATGSLAPWRTTSITVWHLMHRSGGAVGTAALIFALLTQGTGALVAAAGLVVVVAAAVHVLLDKHVEAAVPLVDGATALLLVVYAFLQTGWGGGTLLAALGPAIALLVHAMAVAAASARMHGVRRHGALGRRPLVDAALVLALCVAALAPFLDWWLCAQTTGLLYTALGYLLAAAATALYML